MPAGLPPPPPVPRVFMGLVEVAGFLGGLKTGFDALGVPSVVVDAMRHPFGYPGAESRHGLVRLLQAVTRQRMAARGPLLALWFGFQFLLHTALLCWALPRYDVFLFAGGHSFLEGYDLPILRAFGKRVVAIFLGSDSRPPYLTFTVDATGPVLARRARFLKARLLRFERHAHAVVNSPLTSHFHERPVLDFQIVGIPQLPAGPVPPPAPRGGRLRVLHAPSFREGKGSDRIRGAVERLAAAGLPLDYIEVSGRPHQDVLRELAAADFVVDELYSDTLMATFAAEAAAFGKPAVVGGYGQQELLRRLPPDAVPPVHLCVPHGLEEAIRRLAGDAAYREDLGRRARAFVAERWSPVEVARRYLRIARGEAPPDWSFDPGGLRSIAGWGLTPEAARRQLRRVLEAGGRAALGVTDKPELELRLVDFAEGRTAEFD